MINNVILINLSSVCNDHDCFVSLSAENING